MIRKACDEFDGDFDQSTEERISGKKALKLECSVYKKLGAVPFRDVVDHTIIRTTWNLFMMEQSNPQMRRISVRFPSCKRSDFEPASKIRLTALGHFQSELWEGERLGGEIAPIKKESKPSSCKFGLHIRRFPQYWRSACNFDDFIFEMEFNVLCTFF